MLTTIKVSVQKLKKLIKSSVLFAVDGFRTLIKPREGYRRLFLFLGAINFICYITGYIGTEGSHRILFLERKYKWEEDNTGTYLSVIKFTYWFGLWAMLPLMQKVLKVPDLLIAVTSLTFTAIGWFLGVFTDSKPWFTVGTFILNWFSFGSLLTVMSQCYAIVNRSVLSQAVNPDEIGRIFSVLALFAAIISTVLSSAFQVLYKKTLETLPGAFLLVVFGLTVIAIPINLTMYKLLKTFKKEETNGGVEMRNIS